MGAAPAAPPTSSPALPAASPAAFCATGVVASPVLATVLPAAGTACCTALLPASPTRPVLLSDAPLTVSVAEAVSRLLRLPSSAPLERSTALAEPAAPTTGAAPAAISSAARAIRRVRGRDMMLLRRERSLTVVPVRRSDAVTTGRRAGKVAVPRGKELVMRRIIGST
ncbi:hypothetical protein BKD26_03765 [Streptomyces sp. CB03238]|nr:hypothetical protein BKD26_03765 [Streptomyces sp. CB03238]